MHQSFFAVSVLLGIISFSYLADAKTTSKKVLILGAGISGLKAARTLKDEGIDDFLVLEGQDYIGGRLKQADISGFKVEEGANFIHYRDANETKPLWKQKLEVNLTGMSSNTDSLTFRNETGQQVYDAQSYVALISIMSQIKKKQDERKKENKGPISAREGLSLLGWNPSTPFQFVLEWFFYDFTSAREVEKMAFSTLGGSPEGGTPDFFVTDQRGLIELYRHLYKDFESKILLKKTVSTIKYDSNPIEVKTTDGEVYTADYVLCTFSTGVLASDMVQFTPVLPSWKKDAIANKPLGTFVKIFVKFPKKFWDDTLFIALANSQRGYYPIIMSLDFPGAFQGSGLMLMIVTGDQAKKIENQPFNQTKEQIVQVLRGVYGQNFVEPTDIHYGRWTKNLHVRGAYSAVKAGANATKVSEDMQKNLGNLFFSGEGTSAEWYGYMQGALETGEKQAKMIASSIKGGRSGSLAARVDSSIIVATGVLAWSFCMILAF